MKIKKINEFDDVSRYDCWEIKSLRNRKTNDIITDFDDSLLQKNHNIDGDSKFEYEIYEVKRTTDGQIFKVGDSIKMKWIMNHI